MKKQRIAFLDFARAAAILMVVVCHVVEMIYPFSLEGMQSVSLRSRVFAVSVLTVGRLGVPLFLMISGYLLLGKRYDEEGCKRFWKRNWLHLFLLTIVWILLYQGFYALRGGNPYIPEPEPADQVIRQLFMAQRVSMAHMWYLPMILGVYLLIPYVSNALNSLNRRQLLFPVLIFSVAFFVPPVVNVFLGANGEDLLSVLFYVGFSGGAYGMYLIMGDLVREGAFRKIPSALLALLMVTFLALGVWLQMYSIRHEYYYSIWYDCLFCYVPSVCLFELFTRMRRIPMRRLAERVAYDSFAIFLLHNMVIMILMPQFERLAYMRSIKMAILWLAAIVISMLAAFVINQIPVVGKWLLYSK